MTICGACRYFVRDGRCGYLQSPEGRAPGRPFAQAPFWVWSDCYTDREQVRADTATNCAVFSEKPVKAEGRTP